MPISASAVTAIAALVTALASRLFLIAFPLIISAANALNVM
jgi:hypothetical protein